MKAFRLSFSLLLLIGVLNVSYGGLKQTVISKMKGGDTGMPGKTRQNSQYLPDKIILKLKSEAGLHKTTSAFGISAIDEILQKYSVQSVKQMYPGKMVSAKGESVELPNIYVLNYSSPYDAFSIAEELSALSDVEYAEPWFIYQVSSLAACSVNDPGRDAQWALNKILADSAWCLSTGDTSVVIAIVDNGIQWNHPDLQANIWINYGEFGGGKESNLIDDDGNGKVDDWHGWDFAGAAYNNPVEDNNPAPLGTGTSSGHGTHVGGIASAVSNNSLGVAGIGYKCKLLPVKVASDDQSESVVYGMQGIVYAAIMGADVINCSWGGQGASQFEQEIIDSVTAWGSLVVAAAGNDAAAGNPVHYPASYRGVMSVGSVDSLDVRPYYSEYNEYVDVSAPGERIYSTLPTNTYAYSAGTSMASPLAAGLAALVKSQFPAYTMQQVSEQVRVTCDNINAQNPSYANLIGKGRLNAYNALSQSLPSVRMISYTVKDSDGGNNNGILEPNEEADLVCTFMNYLQPTSASALISLTTTDSNIQMINNLYPVHSVGTMATATNSNNPFRILVKSNPPPGRLVKFTLTMSDIGYSDVQVFSILINPTFATHNVNNVAVSLTNIGRIGYVDLTTTFGEGFVFNGLSQLYEGGLIVGYNSTKVIDNVRNTTPSGQDADFSSSQIYNLMTPGTISAQDGSTMFTDASASLTNRIGLSVNMYSYAFTSAGDSDYVLLRYDLTNTSGSAVSGLYVGLFLDWDVLPDLYSNRTALDASRSLAYVWDATDASPIYCGTRALDGVAGYRGLISSAPSYYSRTAKYAWISGGNVPLDSTTDVHFAISSGPYSIPNNGKQMVGFALLAGQNLAALETNADAAQSKWDYLKTIVGVGNSEDEIPSEYELYQNYPNPFNPVTNIGYDLPAGSKVSLKIFDIVGREITTLVNNEQPAGHYSVPFDAKSLSSGTYFYQLVAGDYREIKKLMLLK